MSIQEVITTIKLPVCKDYHIKNINQRDVASCKHRRELVTLGGTDILKFGSWFTIILMMDK
jgi:hypothetical protein